MIRTKLIRSNDRFNDKVTLGTMFVRNESGLELGSVKTLELPWKDNQRKISCIPTGIYPVKKRFTQKFKDHFHIQKVPNRTWILIHPANYTRQLLGCIAPGLSFSDIDKDGIMDVISSGKAMEFLNKNLPDAFEIEIVWEYEIVKIYQNILNLKIEK